MPTLTCPRCRVRIKVADGRLARPVFCTSCAACLWQPPATTPAAPVATPTQPHPEPVPIATDWNEPPPVQRTIGPDDPQTASAARLIYLDEEVESPRSVVPALCALVMVLGLGFVVVICLAVEGARSRTDRPPALPIRQSGADEPPALPSPRPADGKPAADREEVTWSLDNLCDYLTRRGLEFTVAHRGTATTPGVWLVARSAGNPKTVLVTQFPAAAVAQESLRANPPQKGGMTGFTWGRFLIQGADTAFYEIVRQALS
jgi:hypothetical protein